MSPNILITAFCCLSRIYFIQHDDRPTSLRFFTTTIDCGVPLRRHFRHPRSEESVRIIKGRESKRGAWPWQVSLQLLHPKYGFIGHWCGGVLVHPMWILTAAHCINNELFNLPVAALWTAVLGEWDRSEQSGFYIPIEKIVLHHRYHHYQHDIALMKLSKAANLNYGSKVKMICLPESKNQAVSRITTIKPSHFYYQSKQTLHKTTSKNPNNKKQTNNSILKYLEKLNNMTKTVLSNMLSYKSKSLKYNIRVDTSDENSERVDNGADREKVTDGNKSGRLNAKKLHFGGEDLYSSHHDGDDFDGGNDNSIDDTKDCYVTGWGRSQTNGSLTDKLLEAAVPPLPLEQCQGKYPENLPLRAGHLCAGNTDGSSGTCVGDSGGPLQCQTSDGRWQLLGITSFGSGCAKPGVPDVYTYVPHYVQWISNIIKSN